jgi:acyl transferase domain-containing protein/acyl carrier protein/phospholipid N-methyltransferase
MTNPENSTHRELEIAIIGMSGRFPGAKNLDEFWTNLQKGVESISFFTDEELADSVKDKKLLSEPNFVKARGILEDVEFFDASFFNFHPREAEITDPQHRLFLECAWEALENAGYDSQNYRGSIGVYGGSSLNSYFLNNLSSNSEIINFVDSLQLAIASDKDFLTTRISYKLNLEGPSYTVQTACSTSLVAVHLACQSLLNGECDIALAGGVSVDSPRKSGYFYYEGGVASPDGHCRAFDAKAQGTGGGEGVGLVVLKRMEDALADGDSIHAVIKGSAINNDGSFKVSYTAPRIDSQAKVIRMAQVVAEVEAETINYIETHGSGTALGDPIEVAALTDAFEIDTEKTGFCAIGSVKTNIGHLDAAAGVAGLIKTVLALKHKQIPPSLHFEQPNPKINFANSPFYVNTELSEWNVNGSPRRAGVSSFGIGGTNAHAILEEAPQQKPSGKSRPWQLLMLSAKTNSALEKATNNLIEHFNHNLDLNLADVAHTLGVGRRTFNHRRMVVCENIKDGINALQDPKRVLNSFQENSNRPIAFMFTGLGTHYANMGWELYQTEPTFRDRVDRCCDILKPLLDLDLRDILYPDRHQTPFPNATKGATRSRLDLRKMLSREEKPADAATQKLNQTYLTQPAVFVIEYALAQLWISWGILPVATIGYSIGEYVAACLSGVLSLEDALTLVAKRAQMIQELPQGAMLAVPLSEERVRPLLGKNLSLSAVNGSSVCVVAGAIEVIEQLERELSQKGLAVRRIETSHAFHSQMMNAIAQPFSELVKTVSLHPPQIPYISNVTGTWITAEQATEPSYWVQHLCEPVRFADGIQQLWKQHSPILLEVGAGQTLSSLALQCLENVPIADKLALPSLRSVYERQADMAFLLGTLGQLWLCGIQIDWSNFYKNERRHRIPLPTYPFERQRYWIEPQKLSSLDRHTLPSSITSEFWQSLVKVGQNQARKGIADFDEPTYRQARALLERLCVAYMNLTFRRLGIFNNSCDRYSLKDLFDLFEQCQILPNYRQLLNRWLNVLVEQDQLQQQEGFFTNLMPLSTESVNTLVKEVKEKFPYLSQWVNSIVEYGENMVAILTGEKEPREFRVSDFLDEEQQLSNPGLSSTDYYKGILKTIVEQMVGLLPQKVKLRILEIGAGTGIATEELLPVLPSERTNYTFTDVGGLFLEAAKKKFDAYPFVEYGLLNIEQSPQKQDYSKNGFDLIIAYNVMHVSRKIGEAIAHVRSLLAPGGLLLLWEYTQPRMDADLIDGLLMNPIEDEENGRNMGNPFLSKEQWQEALKSYGFSEVEAFSEIDAFGEHVILAQASSTTKEVATAFSALVDRPDTEAIELSSAQKPELADWFYIPSWKRSILSQSFKSGKQANESGCLVFVDECSLGSQIVERLKLEGREVVTVKVGKQFAKEKESSYAIDPQQKDDYKTLFDELSTLGLIPKTIVHFWGVTPCDSVPTNLEDLETAQDLGFYSLLFLAQTLGNQNLHDDIQIAVVSNNMQSVTGEEILFPEKATVLGAVKVIAQEYPNISCRSIDVVIPSKGSWQEEQLTNRLLTELTSHNLDPVIAYRSNNRWVQTFEPVRLKEVKETTPFREEGVYLITGGLGNVGLVIAEYLAKTVKAKLILTGRSTFPRRDEWLHWLSTHDERDKISCKIRKLLELEDLGAKVVVAIADATDLQQMQNAIANAENEFGRLNGVIYAARSAKAKSLSIEETNKTECEWEFQAKVRGLLVLEKVLQQRKLDFCLLMSSVSSLLGGLGLVDYSAANNFMDTFVYRHNQTNPTPWISANWDTWKMEPESQQISIRGSFAEFSFSPQEGFEALKRILLRGECNQIVVSTGNFQDRVEQWTKLRPLQEKADTRKIKSPSLHPRPNLKNTYVAPGNDLEQKVASIFQELLGIDLVGIYDNFFALGGDSLTGTVLVSKLRQEFQIQFPFRYLMEAPSVAELALAIEAILIEKLEELTEEEVKLTLQGK